MNEPFPGPGWLATLIGIPFFGNQQLASMYNQVDAAVRAVDPNTPLYIEPPAAAARVEQHPRRSRWGLGPIGDPDTVRVAALVPERPGRCAFISEQLARGSRPVRHGCGVPSNLNGVRGATAQGFELNTEMRSAVGD